MKIFSIIMLGLVVVKSIRPLVSPELKGIDIWYNLPVIICIVSAYVWILNQLIN